MRALRRYRAWGGAAGVAPDLSLRQTAAVPAIAMLLAGLVVSQPTTATVRVTPRLRLDVVFNAPPAGIANASRSDMVRAVARGALAFSDLAARETAGAQLDPCFQDATPSPLLCLLLQLRPGFEAARAAAPALDFERIWRRGEAANEARSDIALMVIYAPVLEQDRVQAVLLDFQAMARRYARRSRRGPLSDAEKTALQDELFEVGVLTKPPIGRDVGGARDVQAFMNDLFRSSFASVLQERGLRRFGGIDLRAPRGATVFIDGTAVTSIEADVTRIRDVKAGEHTLRIEHPDYLAYEQPVRVVAEKKRTVAPKLILGPDESAVAARTALLWTGVATMVGGAAVTAAVLLSDGDDRNCFAEGSPNCPPDPRFRKLGPVLGAPLGYSLIGAGATWTLTALFNDDDQTWPWWEFILGAAIGGAAYGISAAANPAAPGSE